MRYRTRNILKKASLILLGIGIIGAVGIGTKKMVQYVKNDTKTLHLNYEVGKLGNDGKYVNDELALYSNKYACKGNSYKLDFNSEINYQVFYYDYLDNFISSTETFTTGESPVVPYNADYARLQITPLNDEDGKIDWKERFTYGKQIKVAVDKKQTSYISDITMLNNERYYVVENQTLLKFVNGSYASLSLDYANPTSMRTARLDKVLLKVKGGSKFSLNKKFTTFENFYINVYQISTLPPSLNTLIGKNWTICADSITLDKSTNYLLLEVMAGHENDSDLWTSNDIENMCNSFIINK